MTESEIYRHLRELRDDFTPPHGLGWPEISDGQIVMMMSPRPRHQLTAKLISRQLDAQLDSGLIAAEATDVEEESLGKLRIPDILVVPEAAMDTDDPIDPREILLAVEIISPSNPSNDYEAKLRDYPAMGIPHYLIVDPRDGTCRYYHGIVREDGRPSYDNRHGYSYGDVITVEGWTIETAGLPRYSAKDLRR
jgi:Uma2 family endonuclease